MSGRTKQLTRRNFLLTLGAGGAARAVVYALSDARASVVIWNRTHARAERLASEFGAVALDDEPEGLAAVRR